MTAATPTSPTRPPPPRPRYSAAKIVWLSMGFVVLVLVLIFTPAVTVVQMLLGIPPAARTEVVAEPVAARHGVSPANLVISPDGRLCAYLWRSAAYYYPPRWDARPHTMTDALEVRWFPLDDRAREQSSPLDAIDLHPDGQEYYFLEAALYFAPDAQHLAALAANYLDLLDPATARRDRLHFPGEYFGGLAWQSPDQLVFSTYEPRDGGAVAFWRYRCGAPPESRTLLYRHPRRFTVETVPGTHVVLPPGLRCDRWPPGGRWALVQLDDGNVLLDLHSGAVRPFPHYVYGDQSWKPDGSAALLHDAAEADHQPRVVLLDPATGDETDLTANFQKLLGPPLDFTFSDPLWTPDGRYVIVQQTAAPAGTPLASYLLQVQPWEVIRQSYLRIARAPLPGWFFLRGSVDVAWVNYDATRKIYLPPEQWAWSPDATRAAIVSDGQIRIIAPTLPAKLHAAPRSTPLP